MNNNNQMPEHIMSFNRELPGAANPRDEKAFTILIPLLLISVLTLAVLFIPIDDVSGSETITATVE